MSSSDDAQRISPAVWAVSILQGIHFKLESLTKAKQNSTLGYYYYCFNKHLQQTYQSSRKKKKKNLVLFPCWQGSNLWKYCLQYKEWCNDRQHSNWRLIRTCVSCLFLVCWLVLSLPCGVVSFTWNTREGGSIPILRMEETLIIPWNPVGWSGFFFFPSPSETGELFPNKTFTRPDSVAWT